MNNAISSLVLKEGGCLRCALRLTGEVSISSYQSILDNQCSCPFCLGILSPSRFLPETISSISNSLYEFADYKFQVTLPPLIHLRHEWLLGKFKLNNVPLARVVDIKDVFKWVFSPLLGNVLKKPFSIESEFRLNMNFECPEDEVEEFFQEFGGKRKESSLTVFKTVNCERITAKFPVLKMFDAQLNVDCSYAPLYITGNYLKLARNVSQTPWSVDGDAEVIDSVQDSMSRVVSPHFASSGCILHSSGREDIDVRMLGTGRPFILEITESKRALTAINTFEELEGKINSSSPFVKVLNLQKTNKDKFEEIRQGEELKLKVYACVVWSQIPLSLEVVTKINDIKDLVVMQKTPIRVMHRRSLMTREKKVLRAKCVKINEHFCELRLVTSAGTYVKEFVHGDFFRTSPSIMEIVGGKTDILQLDVLGLGWNVEEVVELLDKDIE